MPQFKASSVVPSGLSDQQIKDIAPLYLVELSPPPELFANPDDLEGHDAYFFPGNWPFLMGTKAYENYHIQHAIESGSTVTFWLREIVRGAPMKHPIEVDPSCIEIADYLPEHFVWISSDVMADHFDFLNWSKGQRYGGFHSPDTISFTAKSQYDPVQGSHGTRCKVWVL